MARFCHAPWAQITIRGDGSFEGIGENGLDVHVRVRSTRQPKPARLTLEDGVPVITLASGEDGIAPGQACVFYESDDQRSRVLGGGWIKSSERPILSAVSPGETVENTLGADA